MKILILFLLLSATTAFSQQHPPFSEKPVKVDERVFLPYTKGKVIRRISGPQKPVLEQICSIITTWDSIAPPQGMEVFCSGFDNLLEIYFLPYLFEEGARVTSKGGPNLCISLNNPRSMFGAPIAPGIFLCPQRTEDFHGFPAYQNDRQDVTIMCRKNIPLFVPVSQEEYLKSLIEKGEEHASIDLKSEYLKAIKEMEQVYQDLLKTDIEAAKEFKQKIAEFKDEVTKREAETEVTDPTALLKTELSALTAEERNRQAYFAGTLAMEEFRNTSGLLPYANRDKGDALVKANPALIDQSSINQIQLLVISWSIGQDKPRFYNRGRVGFNLANNLMIKLYQDPKIWNVIFSACK